MWKRLILSCLLLVALLGCNDDNCIDCPDGGSDPEPTMANLWPHADGTGWIYDFAYGEYEGPAVTDSAPPLPSLQELHDALDVPVTGVVINEGLGLYRLRFDGIVTTDSGVLAQNIVGTLYNEAEKSGTGTVGASDGERRLLQLIARVRPDLRPRILARLGANADALKSLDGVDLPYFLGGYAFASEDSGYYGYGDLNTSHSWVYLEGDLAVGSRFSLQLLPDLTDDIWLYGQIWSIGDRFVGGVAWPNVLECMYAIDLGLVQLTDEGGGTIGEFRPCLYGSTLFAPEFGPIAGRERRVVGVDEFLGEPGGVTVTDYASVIAQ